MLSKDFVQNRDKNYELLLLIIAERLQTLNINFRGGFLIFMILFKQNEKKIVFYNSLNEPRRDFGEYICNGP